MKKFTQQTALVCRQQFPGLARLQNGKPTIFFDGPAGTQVPQRVADAVSRYLLHQNANRGGGFVTSRETDAEMQAALKAFAAFVGAEDQQEIIFGQNMTTLTFAFARSLAETWQAGDEIIVSAIDHDANITPWVKVAKERGVTVHLVPLLTDDCLLDLEFLQSKLNHHTRLVAVGCACNASGGVNPVREITAWAKAVGAEVFLDAVHYGPHGLIDVKDWGCDFVGFSAYKFFGPHLGAIWARRSRLESLTPTKLRPSKNELPWSWMPGTQSHEAICGGRAAIEYLADIGRELAGNSALPLRDSLIAAFAAIREYETDLAWRLVDGLLSIPGVKILGVTDRERRYERFSTISFVHADIGTKRLANELIERGICLWSGNFYALEFAKQLGLEAEGMIRIGLVHYNTPGEVDLFLHELRAVTASTLAVKA
ncbi:MAG: cysteine desulfurase-like protein [Pirellulaceae bacterium]